MRILKNYGLTHLTKKIFAVISTTLGILSAKDVKGLPQNNEEGQLIRDNKIEEVSIQNKKPALILKLRSMNPNDRLLAHSSHRSHSSHSSHRSHYSSSYGGGGDSGNGGLGIGALVVGGAIALGAYSLGKRSNNKK